MRGNYVAVKCATNAFDWLGLDETALEYNPHITLMWAENSSINHEEVKAKVEHMAAFEMAKSYPLRPTGVDLFENQNGGYSVGLLVDHGCLFYIHQMLSIMGMKHSFPKYQPHLSLTYNIPLEVAEEIKRTSELILDKITIRLTDVVAESTNS